MKGVGATGKSRGARGSTARGDNRHRSCPCVGREALSASRRTNCLCVGLAACDHGGVNPADAPPLAPATQPPPACGLCASPLPTGAAACTRCGAAIDWSSDPRLLRYADRSWLLGVHQGLRSAWWATIASIGLGFIGGIAAMALVIARRNPAAPPEALREQMAEAMIVVMLPTSLVMVAVYALLWSGARPEPQRTHLPPVDPAARRWLRRLLPLAIASTVIGTIYTLAVGISIEPTVSQTFMGVPGWVLYSAGLASFGMWMASLAERLARPRHAQRLRWLSTALAIGNVVLMTWISVSALVFPQPSASEPPSFAHIAVSCLSLPVSIAVLAGSVLLLVWWFQLAGYIRTELRLPATNDVPPDTAVQY
jgi:hypothetical protein